MTVSILQILLVLFCGVGLLAILALGAWLLINRSKVQLPASQQAQLDALESEYAAGTIDEAEYQHRRQRLLSDYDPRMR